MKQSLFARQLCQARGSTVDVLAILYDTNEDGSELGASDADPGRSDGSCEGCELLLAWTGVDGTDTAGLDSPHRRSQFFRSSFCRAILVDGCKRTQRNEANCLRLSAPHTAPLSLLNSTRCTASTTALNTWY